MSSAIKPSISVVIPVHNGGEAFKQCLSSLKQFARTDTEIVVVADGDEDSAKVAEKFGVRVFRNPSAGGPAKARNLGAKQAKGDLLFFVDADVTVSEQTIPQVSRLFAEDTELAAAIGSYDDSPGAANFLSQYKNLLHHYTHQMGKEEASTFWGACGAIRRDIFLKIGGFDENYRAPCVEDIELGYRLKQAGYRIELCKSIQVKHLKRWEIISLLRADFFYRAIPWTALILRDRRLSNDLNLQWSSRISVISVYVLLVALVATLWSSLGWWLVLLASLVLVFLNFSVYQFFYDKRGMMFAIGTIPWHWFYYFYSGLAFAIGTIRHLYCSLTPRRRSKIV